MQRAAIAFILAIALHPPAAAAEPPISYAPGPAAICPAKFTPPLALLTPLPICEASILLADGDHAPGLIVETPEFAAPPQSGDALRAELARACPSEPVPPDLTRPALATCGKFVAGLPVSDAVYADGLAAMANLQLNLIETELALRTAEGALEIAPDHLEAGIVKVEALFRLGRFADARDDVERLLAAYPDDARVRRHYAQLIAIVGSPDDALTAIDRAIAEAPENWLLHHERAALLMRLERPDEALAELDFIIEKLPNAGYTLAARAELHLKRGDAEATIADAEASKATGVLSGRNDFVLVRAHLTLGNLEAALDAATAAAADQHFRRGNPMILLYRFAILHRLHRNDEAEQALATFMAEADPPFVLRVQVFLRNIGIRDVQISGELDDITKRELAACLTEGVCIGKFSEAI